MNKRQNRSFSARYMALSVAVIAIFICCVPNLSFAQVKTSVIAIADAKKLPLGTEVSIEGTVTLPSGAFTSSFSDEGFQVQDNTSGMYVTIKTDLHLTVGQKVRLTGKLTETALKFQIVETDETAVHVLSGTTRPKPLSIATGKISETVIGKLIKITATITKPLVEVAPYGFRLPVDDGSGEIVAYVSTSTGVSEKDLVVGQKIELVGIAGKFNQTFQIYPRSPADVKLVGKVTNRNETKTGGIRRQLRIYI